MNLEKRLKEIKQLIIEYTRKEDWEIVKILTQEQEQCKQREFCMDCGTPISKGLSVNKKTGVSYRVRRCMLHDQARKFYQRALPPIVVSSVLMAMSVFGATYRTNETYSKSTILNIVATNIPFKLSSTP